MSYCYRGCPRAPLALTTLLLAGATAGCDAAPVPANTYTERDSAGIRIVESSRPAWRPGDEWTIGDSPDLHIGIVDGTPEYQFSSISALWQDREGRIIAADRSAAQLRVFDGGGAFLFSFGRQGDGPGEFRTIGGAAAMPGDSILVWGNANRIGVFDAHGNAGHSAVLALPQPEFQGTGAISLRVPGGILGVFSDGTLLVNEGAAIRANPGDIINVQGAFQRYSRHVGMLAELFRFPAGTTRMPDITNSLTLADPYPRQFVYVPAGMGLYTGRSDAFELEHRLEDGSVERVLRAFHVDLTLGEEARQAFRTSMLESAQARSAPAQFEAALRDVEYPPTVPPYVQALVDSDSHLWVRHFPLPGSALPQTWSVFAPEGYLLGTLTMPERFQLRQIGTDFLLGIWTDEFDVQHIRRYGLAR